MAKIAIAKGTIVVLILVVVLLAGGVSAGVSLMSVGPQGLKGDKGDTGANGATGLQGPKGDSGARGAAGAAGSSGATGATGATGAMGASGPAGLGVTPGSLVAPAYDSGWINITNMTGQNIVLTHNIGNVDVSVDIQGRTTLTGGVHQKNLGLTGYTSGWSKTYGGTGHDYAGGNIVQTKDGGYAISGYTGSFGAGGQDALLIKIDSVGNMEWNMTFGGAQDDQFSDMIKTNDGGFVLSGYTTSFGAGNYDSFLMKVNASGTILWNKTYGGVGSDQILTVIQTSDSGYALFGNTNSSGVGGQDYWLIKTDATGNMLWNKTYGGTRDDTSGGQAIVQNSDVGYTFIGRTASFGAGGTDVWLVKTDATGNMLWNKTYGGTGNDGGNCIVPTSDGGYALFAPTSSYGVGGSQDAWLIKIDANGNMIWNKTYGGVGSEFCLYLLQTSDGGFAFCGSENSFGAGGTDVWLVKTDATGNMQWQKTWGGPNNEDAYQMIQTSEGGFIASWRHALVWLWHC